MKKNILIFGLISGIIITTMLVVSTGMLYNNPSHFESNKVVGYAAIIAAFAFIYVGVRNYRNNYNQGYITFGRAFKVGFFIALIASTMYVTGWLIDYYLFIPDFLEPFSVCVINDAKNNGATAAELQSKTEYLATLKEMYKNPLFVILLTYWEVLPLGAVIALISALILKRNPKNHSEFATN